MIKQCRWMNDSGLNQGTSGNISARQADALLITPSAVPYDSMTPEMIAVADLSGGQQPDWQGPCPPSTEWRFHYDIARARPDVGAIVHAHAPYATTLAISRKEIPACHYMIAAFGGAPIRCAGYARYGTQALSDLALEALEDRQACLLANHGMIALGPTLEKAMWYAVELETLARQYWQSLQIGGPVLLSDKEIEETKAAMASYGVNALSSD
ncbi:MAG: class II aldolase/adducin family protein [Pseudomonadota bacterium]